MTEFLALSAITFLAAIVNGALGYGFSSLTVPMALLFMASRVLNPALVLIEIVLNAYVLFVNREGLPPVWRRMLPLVVGLAPGVLIGTQLVARVNPSWMKLATFACLLPLILLQAAGYRRPFAWNSIVRSRLWRRPGRALFGDDDLGATAGGVAQQSGVHEARVPSGARLRARCRVVDDRRGVCVRGAVHVDHADPFTAHRAESRDWCAARRVPDPTHPDRDLPPCVYELRRVGRRVWIVVAPSRAGAHDSAISGALFASVAAFDVWLLYRFFRSARQVEEPAADGAAPLLAGQSSSFGSRASTSGNGVPPD